MTAEADELLRSYEWRVGDLLLNRLCLRKPVLAADEMWVAIRNLMEIWQLAGERRRLAKHGQPRRIMATVCDRFPIYSQTFVYQELMQLVRNGFALRLVYSKLAKREYLPVRFDRLWKDKRRLLINRKIHERDFARYRMRMPDKVHKLTDLVCEASGLTQDDLSRHWNFLQAFSFTRFVEAYRPDYLHSYFFYDRSLMALVASYLLGIPRGMSCYADHLLKDYELKVVPLHLELCDVVVATSERIKRELLEIAPQTDPKRIVVKPNGIDTQYFPVAKREEPLDEQPFRIACVCRIDPKKGLLDLVEAVRLLRQKGLKVEAYIVGEADEWSQSSRDYRAQLAKRISEFKLGNAVHLEGHQPLDGVLRILEMAHVFVAPFVETEYGDKDGIPTALLEAMSTGLPVVATDAGSIAEAVDDGRDGVLVPQHDSVSLADAIERLLRDSDQRDRLGHAGARKIRHSFDVRYCEEVFHKRIRGIIEGRDAYGESWVRHGEDQCPLA
jgi:glycosyltransferase involved in cell wall biosynthesis